MRSSIDYLRHLAESHQAFASSEAGKAQPAEVVSAVSEMHVDSRANISSSSSNDESEEAAAANQSRAMIQARKECRLHLCRLSNEISELQRREEERLISTVSLLREKVSQEWELSEFRKQQKAAELRQEELQRMYDDSANHIEELTKEIEVLTTQSKELELQKTELKVSGFQKRAEIDEMHEYESGITILMYNLREYISGQLQQHKGLEEQLRNITANCDDLRETIRNKENIDLETQHILDSCTALHTDIDALKRTSEELETVNDTLRSKLTALIEERASSTPLLRDSFVKLFKGKRHVTHDTAADGRI